MRCALLMRGINLGANRRVPMAELRSLLGDAGYVDVVSVGQSGNVVLSTVDPPEALAPQVASLISARFGFAVPVLARTGDELTATLAHDPLADVVSEPKRYQVTFLASAPPPAALARLQDFAVTGERVLAHGRELYSWHPEGIARSRLALGLTGAALGASATVRNWPTVARLEAMTRA